MAGFNLSIDLQFRRKRSGRRGTDETEISLTFSIAIILAIVLAALVAAGVITPDTFARMRAKEAATPSQSDIAKQPTAPQQTHSAGGS